MTYRTNKTYTTSERKLLRFVKTTVRDLFGAYPVPAHDEPHAKRVAKNAVLLAGKEKARSIFLCELAGLLHDIGRMREKYVMGETRRHQELSYEMLRDWFRDYREFDVLSKKEKGELLYAIRYHWNDAADQYDTAWILRDADKLDMLGNIGMKRLLEFFGSDDEAAQKGMRNAYSVLHWFHTKTAKQIVEKKKLLRPIDKNYLKLLKKQIEHVEV